MGGVAGGGVGVWSVEVTNEVAVAGLEITRGNVGVVPGVGIVGRRIQLKRPERPNEFVGVEVGCVFVGGFVGVAGVFVGAAGVFVGVVGVFVGVEVGRVFVGVVGFEVAAGGGLVGVHQAVVDRRARPSSGSTEIDAFRLDRRWLCCLSGFIFFSSLCDRKQLNVHIY